MAEDTHATLGALLQGGLQCICPYYTILWLENYVMNQMSFMKSLTEDALGDSMPCLGKEKQKSKGTVG